MDDEPDFHVFDTENIRARTAMAAAETAMSRLMQGLRNLGTHYAHVTSLEVWEDDNEKGNYSARLEWTPA